MKRDRLQHAVLYALLVAGLVPIMIPFVWMLATSLKAREHVSEEHPRLLPWNEHDYAAIDGRRQEVLVLVELKDGRAKVRPLGRERTTFVPAASLERVQRIEPQWKNYA